MSESRSAPSDASDEDAEPSVTSYVGSRMNRREDWSMLTGHQEYVHDRNPPDALHVAYVRSPHPHARIIEIDTTEAESHPGCELVLTNEDYRAAGYQPLLGGVMDWVEWPLADEKVVFVGQCVALVAAENRYLAEDVADLVTVDYEPLDPVVDMMEARKDETVLHEDKGSNVAWSETLDFGDVDAQFEAADHVIEREFDWRGRASGVPIETPGVLAEYHPEPDTERYHIYATQQSPVSIVGPVIHHALDVSGDEVRIEVPHTLGGSFGTKGATPIRHDVLAAVAAEMTGRPVKYVEDRIEDLQAGDSASSDRHYRAKLAVDDDGTFRAMDLWFADDHGGFPRAPATVQALKPLCAVNGPYDIEHLRYGYELVLTNKQLQTAYRGFGVPPQSFVWEMMVDAAADHLDMDPTELRLQNYITPDQLPYQLPSKNYYDSGDYPAMLRDVWDWAQAEEADGGILDPERIQALRAEGVYRGAAPSVVLDPGVGNQEHQTRLFMPPEALEELGERDPSEILQIPEPIEAVVRSDGKVKVTTANESAGQAHDTIVAQLVADELGIDPADVETRSGLDKNDVPSNWGPIASRTAVAISGAAIGVCERLRDQLEALAAEEWDCSAEAVEFNDGGVGHEDGKRFLSLADLNAAETRGAGGVNTTPIPSKRRTVAEYECDHPGIRHWDYFKEAFWSKLPVYPTTSIAANVPIVDVDVETGEVTVRKLYTLRDAGRMLNPTVIDGQYHGGIAQGIGAALQEEFAYDEDGQPQSVTFFDMMLPSATNMPEIEVDHRETWSPFTKSGAKGAGESGIMDIPASIARSINDALSPFDVIVEEIPASSDRVRRLIQASDESASELPEAARHE